ncbi:cupin domain-containing protein [Azospirillum sp.]|uniref:cupin domain-containing protein n=1 Tax=Azospirillum sp. TaxID=34012 RepID=UPI003D72BB12
MAAQRFFVRRNEVEGYHPANHTGTTNRRLIGRDTVGAQHVEVVHGTLEPGEGALPHAHPGLEQVCYVLSGRINVKVGGQEAELTAGDCCFFPAEEPHVVVALGESPAELLVVYAPPYEENPDRVIR